MSDPYEDGLRSKIQDRINNKSFDDYHDDRSNGTFGTKGRETWIKDGKTGNADVSISKEGDGLGTKYIAQIVVPVTSRYERKTFKGIGSEYNSEGWNVSFKYSFSYTIGLGLSLIGGGTISDSATAADHDAVQWTRDALVEKVVSTLKDA
jgi:hypothetical protein